MQFRLPELGEGVHEGELVKWKVKVGDSVKYDQPLCEIMTDKATVEIPSAIQGKVGELHVKEGQTVHVGELMLSYQGATQGTNKEAAQEAGQEAGAQGEQREGKKKPAADEHHKAKDKTDKEFPKDSGESKTRSEKNQTAEQAHARATGNGNHNGLHESSDLSTRVLAAPSTRRLAREMGIDLVSVHGSGPHGRVMKEDLENQARISVSGAGSTKQPTRILEHDSAREERVAFKGLRKKIAEKMRLSKDHAAHFTYVEEADATELVKLRNRAKEFGAKQGIKVTFIPLVMKAMVAALQRYPILNSSLDEEKGELVLKHYYNIGVSVQTEDGLTAPVIKNVDRKSVLEIAQELQDVIERARAKKLTREDLQGGTITLTNAGSIGGLFATPVINYPEVAIVGLNKIFRKPVVKSVPGRKGANSEEIVIRDWTYFSISLDHRVVDGAVGAEFMKTMIEYIENPALLLLG